MFLLIIFSMVTAIIISALFVVVKYVDLPHQQILKKKKCLVKFSAADILASITELHYFWGPATSV